MPAGNNLANGISRTQA